MKDLARYFREMGEEGRRMLALGHPHADPDAVASVKALGEILNSLGAEVAGGIPSNLSRVSKSVLKTVGTDIMIDPPKDADSVVVLDTSSLDQLKDYEEKIEDSGAEIIFIDHHRPDEETRNRVDRYYVDEDASSTTEMILELGQELGFDFGPKTAQLMLTGIISDTGHFRFADNETFKAAASLLDAGADYRKALEALKTPEDPSKRIAMLRATQRSELYKSHGRWIVFSEVGAYESDAASLFVKIGADVSLVASESEEGTRISARSRSGVASETHLHLGELMSKLADHFGGTGGGHAGAAAMTAQAKLEEVKERGLKEAKKMLRPKGD